MHIIIGGCGRVGAELAERLSADGHDVVIVDARDSSFDRLGGGFNGETLVGDITDKDVLVRAGIQGSDALIAVTDLDNANLMCVQIATELFGLRNTVARLFNPQREASYKKMGVHYVSGTRLVAKAILNEIRAGTFPHHIAFEDSDIQVVEMRVHRDGHGATIAELEAGGGVRVAAFRSGVRVRIPRQDDRVREDDIVVAAVSQGAYRHLGKFAEHPLAGGA
ncbi:MAG TPA: TrkA family potassium uptake protein [Egibacteraceae bacterium]|nr:TrkA family potassium uptake protein [Egibacteraceae bacterium]